MTKKDLIRPEFSWETAHFMANACQLAYREPQEVDSIVKGEWGFDEVSIFDVDDQQGFVCSDDKRVIIVFRGTDDFPDWVTNLDLPPVDTAYGKVHRGFQGAWESCEYDVTSALERFDRGRVKEIYVTGHSLGGAIASIAAIALPKTRAIQAVYTFGQPRTGAEAFGNTYESTLPGLYHRIVNDQDIVAMIPPGYSHCGQLYWFDASGALKPEASQTPMASTEEYNRLKGKVQDIKERLSERGILPGPKRRREEMKELREEMPNVDDHMMDNYITVVDCQVKGISLDDVQAKPEDPGAPVKAKDADGAKKASASSSSPPSNMSEISSHEAPQEEKKSHDGVKFNRPKGVLGALALLMLLAIIAVIVIYFFGEDLGIQLLPTE